VKSSILYSFRPEWPFPSADRSGLAAAAAQAQLASYARTRMSAASFSYLPCSNRTLVWWHRCHRRSILWDTAWFQHPTSYKTRRSQTVPLFSSTLRWWIHRRFPSFLFLPRSSHHTRYCGALVGSRRPSVEPNASAEFSPIVLSP